MINNYHRVDYAQRSKCSKQVEELLGKTLVSVVGEEGGDELFLITTEGEEYILFHDQDCCENVSIVDIVGDLQDLVGSPITMAEESTSTDYQESQEVSQYDMSFTWTFYKFATLKGYVTVRWLGQSNGYYSESVSFILNPK